MSFEHPEMSRREFVKRGAELAALASVPTWLTTCGESARPEPPPNQERETGPTIYPNPELEAELAKFDIERSGELSVGPIGIAVYGDASRLSEAQMTTAIERLVLATPQSEGGDYESLQGQATAALLEGVTAFRDGTLPRKQVNLVLEPASRSCLYPIEGGVTFERRERPADEWICGDRYAASTELFDSPAVRQGVQEVLILIPYYEPNQSQQVKRSIPRRVTGRMLTESSFLHEMAHSFITFNGRPQDTAAYLEAEESIAQSVEQFYYQAYQKPEPTG